ncbi:hypothetical protein J6590_074907 [Homalodisca vitripennis]|nr:hypothetical protein J6590_074907 [Homalodisca vitripennis]
MSELFADYTIPKLLTLDYTFIVDNIGETNELKLDNFNSLVSIQAKHTSRYAWLRSSNWTLMWSTPIGPLVDGELKLPLAAHNNSHWHRGGIRGSNSSICLSLT